MLIGSADWIKASGISVGECPIFKKDFKIKGKVKKAVLYITARGVFSAYLDGHKIGNDIMSPGWTVYEKRIRVARYNVKDMLKSENTLKISLASGWYSGRIIEQSWDSSLGDNPMVGTREEGVIALLKIDYENGESETVITNENWDCGRGALRFCDIYDGEIYDANIPDTYTGKAVLCDNQNKSVLVAQDGVPVREHETFTPTLITTACGEKVLDFGQNITGYMEYSVCGKKGDKCSFSFGEILDKNGNFYNANYRTAKCLYELTCCGERITHKPTLTFYGFRYVRIDQYPDEIDVNNFKAYEVHSDIKRTGWITTSNPTLNKLYHNIIWGQKDNYFDIPSDCPQRDERLGWTGDASVFFKTASINFNIEKFMDKWMSDVKAAQKKNGAIPVIVPDYIGCCDKCLWSDIITIGTNQLYETYGDKSVLKKNFPAMKKWVDRITEITSTPYLWTGTWQFADWLELNGVYGECHGKTREDLVATVFYSNSVKLLIKAGNILGYDVSDYNDLYGKIVSAYKETYKDTFYTQTECVLSLYFGLCENKQKVFGELIKLLGKNGNHLDTGFAGTPYLLHVLSDNGRADLAYKLLLRKDYPSWMYSVMKGATTMWEHWDGIKPDGEIWPVSMNSYNHYAYGAVADWMYEKAAGITPLKPGYEEVRFSPVITDKISRFCAKIKTKHGTVISKWYHKNGVVHYEFTTPVKAVAEINGKTFEIAPGKHIIFSMNQGMAKNLDITSFFDENPLFWAKG